MRLIDADELIKKLEEMAEWYMQTEWDIDGVSGILKAVSAVEETPTVISIDCPECTHKTDRRK